MTTVEERDFVLSLLAKETLLLHDIKLWIGVTDYFGTEGVYEWVTGEPWTWGNSNWASGEPSDGLFFVMEDCVCMKFSPTGSTLSESGKFMDNMCTEYLQFVCEYEQ